jgi:hypothetical protein
LYRFLSVYIEKLSSQAIPIVSELVYWISSVSQRVLPKLAKPLNVGIKRALLDHKTAIDLWEMLLERLKDEWDESNVCTSLLGLAVNLRIRYPEDCILRDLLSILQFMWESDDRDEELMAFLPTVFLDIAVNETEKIAIPEVVFEDIFGLMASEEFDWEFEKMVGTVANICEKTGFLYEWQMAAGMMFAHFLTKNEEELREQGFTSEIVNVIGKALNWCVEVNPAIVGHLKLEYRGYQAKMDRLAEVLGLE